MNASETFARLTELAGRTVRARTRLLGPAMLVGLIAGLGGILFLFVSQAVASFALAGVAGFHPAALPGEGTFSWFRGHTEALRPWLLLVIPTVGGLVSGVLIFSTAPEAEGHGTDAAIEAYHFHQGSIRPRVPLIKMLASAITIGTGGSGGREGPIAQIGAGFGSMLANLLRLPPADRRVLMGAGVGAGIAAIFKSPLAGALFAAEVLYSSPAFEPEVIIPAGVASVVSYCTAGAFAGYRPLFAMPDLVFSNAWELGPYLLLALFMTLLAMLYTRTFYGTARAFRALKLAPHVRPAVGAFASGAVALTLYFLFHRDTSVLAVMSYGYDALQNALSGGTAGTAAILMAIALGKIATTSLTIGSGGSGGVFGPSMVIGGCGGGALGIILHRYAPSLVPNPAAFVIVGMGGFFAAAAKTPFSTIVIVSEMTGGYGLLLPALWVCTLSFLVSDRMSIYGSQLESRASSPAHRREILDSFFRGARIASLLTDSVPPALRHKDLLTVATEPLRKSAEATMPVVDDEGRYVGLLLATAALGATNVSGTTIADVMSTSVAPLRSDEGIDAAMRAFVEGDAASLPVVDEKRRLLGVVRRGDVAARYLQILHGESDDDGAPLLVGRDREIEKTE